MPGATVTVSPLPMDRLTQSEAALTMSPANPIVQNEDSGDSLEPAISCNGCRKRKLKCSREAPACQNCRKIGSECVYESKRGKPGLRAGAVENLHRRLDNLEKIVVRLQESGEESESTRNGGRGAVDHRSPSNNENVGYNILSFLAKEFQRFNDRDQQDQGSRGWESSNIDSSSRKRRRLDENVSPPLTPIAFVGSPHLPQPDDLDELFEVYFSHIHPWIPMIHQGRLRRRLSNPLDCSKLEVVLQAIVLIGSRFRPTASSSFVQDPDSSEQLRSWIIANSMSSMSLESLQALIIVAFNDIGNGEAEKAWSLVGSLTRTVEYMQLTIEDEEQTDRYSISQPFASLDPSKSWTEAEERRRVFWNIFNLDRFCSVSMGWNTSLTSDDVHRRLPCDGIHWRKQNQVSTPYFGIWDKSAGRIGNPITFLPSHHFSPSQPSPADEDVNSPADPTTQAAASPEGFSSSTIDVMMSTVGAFAYSIEATESLSRVTTYFLQQKLNFKDPKDISSWLTRFKELDLRLVHWKMLLPKKWKAHMESKQTTPGKMDPNLTLAHVTHNASMILLHQPIAFPPAHWDFKSRLPSSWSAETCRTAAVEIAIIAENYLKITPQDMPLAAPYAFCLYIAGRVLLAHWRYYGGQHPAEEVWSLVQSLENMSRRWTANTQVSVQTTDADRPDLAAKYAITLRKIHENCTNDKSYQINVLAYTRDVNHRSGHEPKSPSIRRSSQPQPQPSDIGHIQVPHHELPQNQGLMTQRMDSGYPQPVIDLDQTRQADLIGEHGMNGNGVYPNPIQPGGDLNAISQLFLNQQFIGMDRIISYDDGMFATDLDGSGW